MKISVVVPVFAGENTLPELLDRIKYSLINFDSFEVLFIHDGGSDLSWETICELKSLNDSLIEAIKLPGNFGQHYSTMFGIKHAKGDLIVTMDEDLQHAPEDISVMITNLELNNSDLVYGSYKERRHSIGRNIMSKILNRLLRCYIPGLHKDFSSFRLMKAEVAEKISSVQEANYFIDGALSKKTDKITSVKVSHSISKVGKSSYSFKKLLWHTFGIFIAYSIFFKKEDCEISVFHPYSTL